MLIGLLALGAVTDWMGGRFVAAPRGAEPAGIAAPAPVLPAPAVKAAAAIGEPVDLNRASLRELDALPGVGPVLAARIIDHRTRHGAFRSKDDLRAVRGIGPRLFERLEPLIRAAPALPEPRAAVGAADSIRALRPAP